MTARPSSSSASARAARARKPRPGRAIVVWKSPPLGRGGKQGENADVIQIPGRSLRGSASGDRADARGARRGPDAKRQGSFYKPFRNNFFDQDIYLRHLAPEISFLDGERLPRAIPFALIIVLEGVIIIQKRGAPAALREGFQFEEQQIHARVFKKNPRPVVN